MPDNSDVLRRRDDEAKVSAERYHVDVEVLRRVRLRIAMLKRFGGPTALRKRQRIEKLEWRIERRIERYRPNTSTPTGLAIHLGERLRDVLPNPDDPNPSQPDTDDLEHIYTAADYWYHNLIDEGYPLPSELCRRSDENLEVHLNRMLSACTRWQDRVDVAPSGTSQAAPESEQTEAKEEAGCDPERTKAGGIGQREAKWPKIKQRLIAELVEQDEPYTSDADLARRMVCSRGTIAKALENSLTLSGWKEKTAPATSKRAFGLNEVTLDSKPDDKAPEPAEVVEADEAINRVLQDKNLTDEQRDQINAMTPEQKQKVGGVLADDPDAYDCILGRRA